MVNLNELNKIKKLFENSITKQQIKINLPSTKAFKTKFFENNFFENHLKPETFIEITKDETIEIKGTGIVNIKIKNNSNILLNIKNKTTTLIRIIIEKNINVNIAEITNNKEIYKYLQIYQKENSTVNFNQFILNSRINYTKTYIKKNTNYQINSGYITNNSENFIRSEIVHLQGKSTSNQKLNGASINNGKVICDGLIKINKKAEYSKAHLNISGLILDKTSKITSEPILEVDNNIVSCSHGCSISQVSTEIEFYMMSRGLTQNQITELIIQSYFEIPLTQIKSIIQKNIIEKTLNKLQ